MSNIKQARDKMATYGINAMTDTELLTAAKYKGDIEEFYQSFEYKAVKELIRRRETPDKVKVKSSQDIYKLLSFLNDESEESFYIITLNRANNVINTSFISKGHDYAVVVSPKQIASIAIKEKANSVVISHNHPSGNTRPSQQDIDLTRKVKQALELFDIIVLDHMIVARDNGYYSFADEGIL